MSVKPAGLDSAPAMAHGMAVAEGAADPAARAAEILAEHHAWLRGIDDDDGKNRIRPTDDAGALEFRIRYIQFV